MTVPFIATSIESATRSDRRETGNGVLSSSERANGLNIIAVRSAALSIVTSTHGMRVAPYFTPVFGVGETSSPCPSVPIPSGSSMNCDKSGVRWVLGGGIGLWNPESGVAATVGMNQVVLSGARPVFGINVILGGR